MRQAESLYPGQPFRIITDLGEVVILPPELADELRNEPRLSFSAAVAIVCPFSSWAALLSELTVFSLGLPFQCPSVWFHEVECVRRSDYAEHRKKTINSISLYVCQRGLFNEC
jgi:hypothetical protein